MTKIGSIAVSTIFELDASQVIRDIIPNASPSNIQAIKWLAPHYADSQGNISAVSQSFLLRMPSGTVVIDTGVGNGRARPEFSAWDNLSTAYLDNLKQQIDPQAVDLVICTHLHFDHIGWNTVLVDGTWTHLFPNARYIFVKDEFEYWMSHPTAEDIDDLNGIEESVKPLAQAGLIELVAADARITDGVQLIPGYLTDEVLLRVEAIFEHENQEREQIAAGMSVDEVYRTFGVL